MFLFCHYCSWNAVHDNQEWCIDINCTSVQEASCKKRCVCHSSWQRKRKDKFPEHFICYVVLMIVVTGLSKQDKCIIAGNSTLKWRSCWGGRGLTGWHSQGDAPWRIFLMFMMSFRCRSSRRMMKWSKQMRDQTATRIHQTRKAFAFQVVLMGLQWWQHSVGCQRTSKSATIHRAAHQHQSWIVYWPVASPECI